jgi:hypothetical protein
MIRGFFPHQISAPYMIMMMVVGLAGHGEEVGGEPVGDRSQLRHYPLHRPFCLLQSPFQLHDLYISWRKA